ncbi:PRA1 family protein G2 [Syzygium oleosum]|uniref:PRA1 family protein G2 n=1 Tax=Syzygium oleosum TaxID=219896 RepID=UPI0011D28F0A|nr:PRA1 family protein G2 [Syzygium oleosum]
MQPPAATHPKPAASAPGGATYTTIPISISDVISRSVHNFSAAVSRHRPWPEFVAAGSFDRPGSASAALARIRKNSAYFRVNYVVAIAACALVSLLGAPFSLIVFASVLALWLIFHFFREDPLMVSGHQLNDRLVLCALVLVSLSAIWFVGRVENLVIGIGAGSLLCGVHGVLRNPDGLFLDEDEAASQGLIGSRVGFAPAPGFGYSVDRGDVLGD